MKKIILAIALAAVASMAVASFASAGVDRYQVATGLTVSALGGTYVHTYQLTNNPATAPARSPAPAESRRSP